MVLLAFWIAYVGSIIAKPAIIIEANQYDKLRFRLSILNLVIYFFYSKSMMHHRVESRSDLTELIPSTDSDITILLEIFQRLQLSLLLLSSPLVCFLQKP